MASAPHNLSSLLESPDEEVRRNAVFSLQELPGSKSLPLLDQALGDESWRVRKAAVEAFRSLPDGAQATRALIEALTDSENAGRRTGAMEALIAMGRGALPYLHDSIHHPDGDVERFTLCELCIDALCLLQLEMVPGVRRVPRPVATS